MKTWGDNPVSSGGSHSRIFYGAFPIWRGSKGSWTGQQGVLWDPRRSRPVGLAALVGTVGGGREDAPVEQRRPRDEKLPDVTRQRAPCSPGSPAIHQRGWWPSKCTAGALERPALAAMVAVVGGYLVLWHTPT